MNARRLLSHATIPVIALASLMIGAPAHAATCTRTDASLAIALASGDNVTMILSGATITLSGGGAPTCEGATTSSIDEIAVTSNGADESFTIDLSQGAFAPGFTAESTGVSEIEISVALGAGTDRLTVKGGAAADAIDAGVNGIDLSSDVDPDVTVSGIEAAVFIGEAGNDLLQGDGDPGDPEGGLGGPFPVALEIRGDNGDDSINGGAAGDLLIGGNGNDTLGGLAGDDVLRPGDGVEVGIDGGAGTDTLDYSDTSTSVAVNFTGDGTGSAGTDTFSGIENLIGSSGNDQLNGDGLDNVIDGGPGTGSDAMTGGAGSDTLSYATATSAGEEGVTVDLAVTTPQDTENAGTDTQSGFERLAGSPLNDHLSGTANADVISGAAGNDELVGAAGDDTLNGGADADTADFADSTATITADLGAGTIVGDGSDTVSGVENVTSGSGNDALTGDGSANVLKGGDGDDTLAGAGGDDRLDGQNGADTAAFGAAVTASLTTNASTGEGDDVLVAIENLTGSSEADRLIGGNTANVLTGGDGDDVLDGADGDDTLRGGDGSDTASFVTVGSAVVVNLATPSATGQGNDTLESIENAQAGAGADQLVGSSDANRLDGGGGTDTIDGAAGDDTLIGGAGDDELLTGGGDDVFYGGAFGTLGAGERDRLSFAARATTVQVDLALGTANGDGADTLTAIDDVRGGSGDDELLGNSGDNTLEGLAGADTIAGNGGNDGLHGGDGADTLTFAAHPNAVSGTLNGTFTGSTITTTGFESLVGSAFGDTLAGDAAVNTISGGPGNDSLNGGDAADTLNGGDGNDVLHGGLDDDADALKGDGGTDTASLAGVTADLSMDLADGQIIGAGTDTLTGVEGLLGGSGDDELFGDAGHNVLDGGPGNDLLDGGVGNDDLFGGIGDDELLRSAGDDDFDGGAGEDLLDFDGAGAVVASLRTGKASGDGADTIVRVEALFGGSGNDRLEGGIGSDYLDGGSGADTLIGQAGHDLLVGGAGNDLIGAGSGNDVMIPGAGNDYMNGSTGFDYVDYSFAPRGVAVNLTLARASNEGSDRFASGTEGIFGSRFRDFLAGNGSANIIFGQGGNDVISGYNGNDRLDGGAGSDFTSGGNGFDRCTTEEARSSCEA